MKKELRLKFKQLRNENGNFDETISENLATLVQDYHHIAIYLKIGTEINLEPFISKYMHIKNLYVPYVKHKTKILEFRKLSSLNNLVFDDAHIPSSPQDAIAINKLDVIVLSCLACNLQGYRLGYGGGYYDQSLTNYQGLKIGIVYENCLTDIAFQEPFDIRLDYIITEKRIIAINKE